MKHLSSSRFKVIFECMKSDMIHSIDNEDWGQFEYIVESDDSWKLIRDHEGLVAIECEGLFNCMGDPYFRIMPRKECLDVFEDKNHIDTESRDHFFIKGSWLEEYEENTFTDEQMKKVTDFFHVLTEASKI